VQSVSEDCTASVVDCRATVRTVLLVIASLDGVPVLRVGPGQRVTFLNVSPNPNPLLLVIRAHYQPRCGQGKFFWLSENYRPKDAKFGAKPGLVNPNFEGI